MATTGKRNDPAVVAFFRVEIESIDSGRFSKCSGLKTETEVFEYQEGGVNDSVHKLVGPSRASNIVLTRGYISDVKVYEWREGFVNRGKQGARHNGAIIALGNDGKTVLGRWNFTKAWPVRWEMTEFDSHTGQAACETLELAVEKITKG
jgi:phage tail-like protein